MKFVRFFVSQTRTEAGKPSRVRYDDDDAHFNIGCKNNLVRNLKCEASHSFYKYIIKANI